MAGPNYSAIKTAVKAAIDAATPAISPPPRVLIEDSIYQDLGQGGINSVVGIYIVGRRRSSNGEPLAAGTRGRYVVEMVLWCLYFDMNSLKDAIDGRDALVASVEQVLMRDRTLGGTVAFNWQEGGEMFSARDAQPFPFVAGGEIKLFAEINFTST